MTTSDEMNNFKNELSLLTKSLENKSTQLNDILANKTGILNKFIEDFSNENLLLQSLSRRIEDKFSESVPQIASELDSLNKAKIQKLEESYLKIAESHAELFSSSEEKLNQLAEKLDSIDTRKFKRFFLGICITTVISVTVSAFTSYFMMRSFPVKAIINYPENIILNESQVSLWGTDNTKVLKNRKN